MTESDERKPRTPFLIALSGARPEVLERCPTERIKFQSLGWAILITCCMAIVSMWFALTSALGFNPVLSFPVAVLWGLVIMGIDRWLVTSMPIDGKRKFLIAAPRLVLALLLGSLISTPIVLRIFESEINNQISVIKANNEATFLSSQQHSAIQGRITQWQNTVTDLDKVIDSNGTASINPASDGQVQTLNSELSTAHSNEATDYADWQCQLYQVGANCKTPKGNGPLAQADHTRYLNDVAQVSSLTQQIQARDQQLETINASSASSRLAQAKGALPNAQAQLAAAQTEENSLTNNFQSTNSASNGLLIRLKALDQLAAGSSTLQAARILLFLLFLTIEILPVTVKLLQRPGNYEKILSRQIANELSQAQWEMRGAAVHSATGRQASDLRPTPADAGHSEPRSRQRDPIDEEFERVWEQHTRAAPVADWESRAGTAYLSAEEDVTGPHRLDEVLRDLPDTRAFDGFDERQGGSERQYGSDDL